LQRVKEIRTGHGGDNNDGGRTKVLFGSALFSQKSKQQKRQVEKEPKKVRTISGSPKAHHQQSTPTTRTGDVQTKE